MTDTAGLLAIAQEAVEIGYRLVRGANDVQVHRKGDRDLVTDVDVAVERAIRSYLQRETPRIGFLGEEDGGKALADADSPVWTLDPVDGTSNFAHGVPLCAVSLALVCDGESVVAAIAAPLLDLRYHAMKGGGAFGNGQQLRVSDTADLVNAIVSIGDYAVGIGAAAKNLKRFRLTALLAEHVERIRMFGTAALDLAWMAEGRTDAMVMLANEPWDTAAGVLIAREAGARVMDLEGADHTFSARSTVAATPAIANELLKLLATI